MNFSKSLNVFTLICYRRYVSYPTSRHTRFCKEAMLAIPDIICSMCCRSLQTGMIPMSWTKGVINVFPKDGDLSDPGNWRPITQTSIFAKLLEKLVHKRLLKYFLDNNIISDYQFGF